MKTVSVIPARGGSKGIPRKNLRILAGEPLISYAIKASLSSSINETYVSTEDQEIKEVSLHYGAKVIDRPIELAQDNSSTEEVISHFCSIVDCDRLVLIQPTSPLVRFNHINDGLHKMFYFDSVFSAVKSNDILVWNESMQSINYDYLNRGNRQSRKENIIIETGGFYIFSKDGFIKSRNRLHGRIGYVEVPFWSSFEVDCEEDLYRIQNLLTGGLTHEMRDSGRIGYQL